MELSFDKPPGPDKPGYSHQLESAMHWVSLILATTAFAMAVSGLVYEIARGSVHDFLALKVLPLNGLLQFGAAPLAVYCMSVGIVLLGMIPIIRVFVAAWLFLRAQRRLETVVAAAVLLELVASMYIA